MKSLTRPLAKSWIKGEVKELKHYVGRVTHSTRDGVLAVTLWDESKYDNKHSDLFTDVAIWNEFKYQDEQSHCLFASISLSNNAITSTGPFYSGVPFDLWTWVDDRCERVHLKSMVRK